MRQNNSIFKTFFQGGFECSSHRRSDGVRLDLIAATKHDIYTLQDYKSLINYGICTVRDGLRWHLIEKTPGYYDWSSFIPMLHATRDSGIQVIWDLCHYGYPDDIDIWKPQFVKRFVNFANAVAKLIKSETDCIPFYSLINEISFWSWAGGEASHFMPKTNGRGFELKHQLVNASITAMETILKHDSRARFVQAEPLINIINPDNIYCQEAKGYSETQYQTWDMLRGTLWPGLGGHSGLLDIIGINYYPHNQRTLHGDPILQDHPLYMPFAEMLLQVYKRYKRPIFIAETGAEGQQRLTWLQYICDEVATAIEKGVPIEGICLYPITDYPGWEDDRICETGLLGSPNEIFGGKRIVYQPLAQLILQQQAIIKFIRLLQ